LAYYFTSQKFFDAKCKYARGTKVIDISAKDLAKIQVPVPPLPVQAEIVSILDKSSEFEAEIEVQLAAELVARKKQYEYYRNTFPLTFVT
jgi:type I restriction enzyme S subunit